MNDVQNNTIDFGVITAMIGGWAAQVDWAFWCGLLVGVGTIIARVYESQVKKAAISAQIEATAAKERENQIESEKLAWEKEIHAKSDIH